jgi:hypothetical protein
MRVTRKRIATGLQASLLVLLAGCGSSSPPPEARVGAVLLPDATLLSAEPGAPPVVRPATNLALVVEHRGTAARVLAADGTHGWTASSLPEPSPVAVDCPSESYPLFRQSPDQVSPETGDVEPATARTGTLLGASTRGYPASQRILLAPPRFQIVMPTLRVRCGIDGYAPPEWLRLQFQSPPFDAVEGLVRRPFVGPALQGLLARRPSPAEMGLTFLEDQLVSQASGASWTEVEAFYRDPADATRTFTVYAAESARLYDFSQPPVRLYFPMYTPYAARVVSSKGEWFVEVVSIYGDGTYSTLFHIRADGTAAFHPLSRSSGELAEDTRASWGVLGDQLWIARATGSNVTLAGTQGPLYLAVLRTAPEYAEPLEPSAAIFPASDREGWIIAVPFRSEGEALQRAAGRQVRRYPQ